MSYHEATAAFQRALLRQALTQAQGHHTAAAQALGRSAPISTACSTLSASAHPDWIHPVSERIQAPWATRWAPTGSRPAPARYACTHSPTPDAPRPTAPRRAALGRLLRLAQEAAPRPPFHVLGTHSNLLLRVDAMREGLWT
jgi:hypothetical protein